MILILGGTGDSVKLAEELYKITDQLILSTATDYGAQLARVSFGGTIVSGQMDYEALKSFCGKYKVQHIVDATHPYAQIITENAIRVSEDIQITYDRYERPYSQGSNENMNGSIHDVIHCKDYETAGKLIEAGQGNVLITTGSRQIEKLLSEIKDIKRVFTRILPKSEHLIKLEALGLMPEQIIAMKGPFSLEMNKLMLQQTNAKYLVTKESGSEGNTDEKLQAAKEMTVQVIMIQRPEVKYPNICYNVDEMVYLISNRLMLNT